MPKVAKELAPLVVKRLTKPGLHAVGGVPGLHLQIKNGSRAWILRTVIGDKRRDVGLGAFPAVPLAEAREKARATRAKIEEGIDPIEARKEVKSLLAAAQARAMTFDEASKRFIEAKAAEWKNPKHRYQWEATLTYAGSVIGKMQVRDITLAHIVSVLEPIWKTKTETATRLRGRIEQVLDWATVSGHRQGENPARWRGNLDKVLPRPSKIAKVTHLRALPVDSIGEFMTELRKRDGMAARALELAILTAARSGEVRGATWSEVDMKTATWTIPAARMKAGREHRIPLSPDALKLLKSIPRFKDSNFIFPGPRGHTLSDMALLKVMRDMKVDAVPHGFRSSFRDWCAERTNWPREIAEQALAHRLLDKVEEAYRRSDLFEKRRLLMAEWARFCSTLQNKGEVIAIRGGRK